ncbi:O-fucosyltransferase 15-like isoform X2 [Wolffia australiana]
MELKENCGEECSMGIGGDQAASAELQEAEESVYNLNKSFSSSHFTRDASPVALSQECDGSKMDHQYGPKGIWKLKFVGGDSVNSVYRQQHRRRLWKRRLLVGIGLAVVFFFMMNWRMLSFLEEVVFHQKSAASGLISEVTPPSRLILRSSKTEPPELWKELPNPDTLWMPCADKPLKETQVSEGNNGYILVRANGGISQQRIAICNAVAVASLLNATLVIPKFLYSSVWTDPSQFGDIYQEDFFMDILGNDIRIVKELPLELESLDLESVGSLVTDSEIMKESKPRFFLETIVPILKKNKVVLFVGFGNRLAFDPIPFRLQRLRCKCNFHALKFVRKIQETGSLLIQRMRNHRALSRPLEQNLLGPFAPEFIPHSRGGHHKYLALHLRFEIDMAAYSLCSFGGGKEEETELETYRLLHFPALAELKNSNRVPSAANLRSEGLCPLTPEEAVLMLVALGFNRKTSLYVAGANVYGGRSRMAALSSLFPNLVTKESLLSPFEIQPFLNFSSQLAALDFIACAAADSFAMTDSGSQFSSLVSGYRMYYGSGVLPTIRPNKRRLAAVFSRASNIEWRLFERSTKKAMKQMKRTVERPLARSIYRHPRCVECMCKNRNIA